jgi:hypothetical protein
MKAKLLLLVSVVLFFSFSAAGQQTPKDADNNLEEMEKAAKELIQLTYDLTRMSVKEMRKTKDVRDEAEKYFQAWIKGDAATVFAYQPPFVVKRNEEADKVLQKIFKDALGDDPKKSKTGEKLNQLDDLKLAMKEMNKDTFKYNSVKIGEIIETGILDGDDAPKERFFAVVKYTADVYFKGKQDILNGRIIGYTDGSKWYFEDRSGVPENVLKEFGISSKTENQ